MNHQEQANESQTTNQQTTADSAPKCRECKTPKNINELVKFKIDLFLNLRATHQINFFNDIDNDFYNEPFKNNEDKKTKIIKFIINTLYGDLLESEILNIFILATIYIKKEKNFFILIEGREEQILNIYKLYLLILKNSRCKKINIDCNEFKQKNLIDEIKRLTKENEEKQEEEEKEVKEIFFNEYKKYKAPLIDCLGCFEELKEPEEDKNIIYYACNECKNKNLYCLDCAKKCGKYCPYCRKNNLYLENNLNNEIEKNYNNNVRILNNNIEALKKNINNIFELKLKINNKQYNYNYEESEKLDKANLNEIEYYNKYNIVYFDDKQFINKEFIFYKKENITPLIENNLYEFLFSFLDYRSQYTEQDFYKFVQEELNIPARALEEIINNIILNKNEEYETNINKNRETLNYLFGLTDRRGHQNEERLNEIINNIYESYYNLNNYENTELNDLEIILNLESTRLLKVLEDLYILVDDIDEQIINNLDVKRINNDNYINYDDDLTNIIINYEEDESETEE
jgi:hypothetical protein